MIRYTSHKDTLIILLFVWIAYLYQDRTNIIHDKKVTLEMLKQCDAEYYILKWKMTRYGR